MPPVQEPEPARPPAQQSPTWPGSPFPQGASYDGRGTNFSLYSEGAEAIELCLFDGDAEQRIEMKEVESFNHHVYLPGCQPGQRYGFRVHGPWAPEQGLRFNPHKLLLDPYGKAVDGEVDWDPAVYAYDRGDPSRINTTDSAPHMPRSVVVNPYFEWREDRSPKRRLSDTVIYETHVRGLTMRHPDVAPELRGTYAGLATDPVIAYLTDLGVTAVELMPVHEFVHDQFLVDRGLRNYWGYQSINYLAPHHGYAAWGVAGQQVQEFKHMVSALHNAGIEVILDVVYNHTGEGNHSGPSLAMRGVDNAVYYRIDPNDPSRYIDYTGTGNSLNVRSPHVLRLIMDSLRYWVLEMHVDGFRFDLAAALARELHDVDRLAAFFDIIQQDPIISQVKLIAEPWDIGEGGYQVGNFPTLWSEWNGKYRDEVRGFWRGDDQSLGEFAYRFTGSSDLYESNGRRPAASINFITSHDGFTLRDLVSYDEKHNDANGENNRDGENHNLSWNSGVEGPTDDVEICRLRARRVRSFLVTLMLSQGVPMLVMGDEIGRTQGGNNNAYAQDNEVSWVDWLDADVDLLEFTRRLIAMRRHHPVFRRRRWFHGRSVRGGNTNADIGWFTEAGTEMTDEHWNDGLAKTLTVWLNGDGIPSPDEWGDKVLDDDFLLLFNAAGETVRFTIPPAVAGGWVIEIDTAAYGEASTPQPSATTDLYRIDVVDRSVIVLRRPRAGWPQPVPADGAELMDDE